MIVNSKDLAGLLGVSSKTLRNIKSNNQLSERLKAIGYNLVEEFKEGRAVYYRINDCKPTNQEALFNKEVFGTEHDGFKHYYMNRTESAKGKESKVDDVITKKQLSEIAGADVHTISRWDGKLIELGILSEDGYVYLRFCSLQITKASREEYAAYMKQVRAAKELHSSAMLAYRRDEISKESAEIAQKDYESTMQMFARDYVTRISVYKLNPDNPVHVEAVKLYTKSM